MTGGAEETALSCALSLDLLAMQRGVVVGATLLVQTLAPALAGHAESLLASHFPEPLHAFSFLIYKRGRSKDKKTVATSEDLCKSERSYLYNSGKMKTNLQ